ncbi:hypothetical protein ACFQ4C_30525 [Larkinella insperata]|uniref:DUF7684 domain-containing protein n=1 Tax=Larkinella insperata TaxID=332158 RepID=A0ABW3QN88_9BACT
MNLLGAVNEREVYYFQLPNNGNWFDFLPFNNWLVIPISNERDEHLINVVAEKCLEKKVTYICTTGKDCEYVHDIFDETIVINRLTDGLPVDSPDDFEHEPMTTWNAEIAECLWFALYTAHNEYNKIEKVVCLDLTRKESNEKILSALISQFQDG